MLFAFLPPAAASNLFLLLHVFAGLAFTYLLARELGQSRVAATLAAPAFALSAFFLARFGIFTIITNGVWLPGLLWLARRYGRTGDNRYAWAGGAGGALALLSGQFQLASYAVVAAALYAAFNAANAKGAARGILAFGALPLALAAVQLVPTFELWRLSERAADTRAGDYSFWPPQFLSLLLPDIFGRSPHPAFAPLGAPQLHNYWGRSSFVESAFYVGIVPLILAAVGFVKRRRWFFLAAGGAAALFACGTFTPLFAIYKYIPPFAFFRAPGRLLIFPTLALALAAGDGLDCFRSSRRPALIAGAVAFMAAVAVVLAFRFSLPRINAGVERIAAAKATAIAGEYGNAEGVRAYYAARAAAVSRKIGHAARLRNPRTWFQLGCLAGALVVFGAAWRYRRFAAAAPYILLLFTAGDLYHYGRGLNAAVPAGSVTRPPPPAAVFTPSAGDRIFSSGYELGPRKQLGLGLIHKNTHALWRYELLTPRASLRPSHAAAVFDKLEALYTTAAGPGGKRFPRPTAPPMKLFSTFGFKYFIRLTPWLGEEVSAVGYAPPYFVYKNGGAERRARLVSRYRVAAGDGEALRTIMSAAFEPGREVVLAEAPAEFAAGGGGGQVYVERRSPLEVVCRTVSPGAALLVLDELYYPGWTATIDGRRAKIYRANVMSRAVVVGAGRHVVRFVYRPAAFYGGLALSLLAWAAVVVAVVAPPRRRGKRRGAATL